MQYFFITLASLFLACNAHAQSLTLDDIVCRLSDIDRYSASVDYEVLLPSADDPIVYKLKLQSQTNDNDSLAPASYIIDWSADGKSSAKGFSAYFGGNYYRFRDFELQEFHFSDDPIPFTLGKNNDYGIQNQSQFSELLPQYLARTLSELACDSTYKYSINTDSVISGVHVVAINGVRSYRGNIANTFIYIFDKKTLFPLSIERTSNPGSVVEQFVSAIYSNYCTNERQPVINEKYIAELYPKAFQKYRQANFSFDNLIGRRIPEFSLPVPGGSRYAVDGGSRFNRPTIIALLDSERSNSAKIISRLRQVIDSQSQAMDLLLIFIDNNTDRVTEAAGQLKGNEHLMMSGRGLCHKLGIKNTPVIIGCDCDATIIVTDSKVDNNSIENIVIKMTAQAAHNNI